MVKERLSVLIFGGVLLWLPASANAGSSKDISVGTIYFADGTSQSTATLQGQVGPAGAAGPQGAAGANGYNSLLLVTGEISGANCETGGTKIQVGLDQDRNGALDFAEVVQTNYICSGTGSVTPPLRTVTVTASPSPQTVNSFVNITANIKSTELFGGDVYFSTSGPFCKLYDPDTNEYSSYARANTSPGGTSSVALTSSTTDPCIVYADYPYYDNNTNTWGTLSGSALATFLPQNSTTPVMPPPPPITVTASPSTQTVSSFVNITATLGSTNQAGGSVYFYTPGPSCKLHNPETNDNSSYGSASIVPGGTASVALTSSTIGPCIVYASYYDTNTSGNFSSSTLATFVSPQN